MFYCQQCNQKFRNQPRKCPNCGGHCVYRENRSKPWIIAICILAVILVGLIVFACNLPEENDITLSNPSTAPSVPISSENPTTAPTAPTSAPTEPTVPTTQPTQPTVPPTTAPSGSSTGMYTRAELEAMDSTYNKDGFGAGRAQNHLRPSYPVSEQAKYAQYNGLFIGEDTNTVYLTFDCGYEYYAKDENGKEYPVTEKILDVLKEKNVKAVFFITKDYVDMSPDLVQRMVDEGHVLGNHTVYHPVMPAQSIDRMEREVMNLHNLVLEKYGYKMTLFRPPTGAYSIQSLAVLQNLGYTSVLWSFQHYDYDPANQPALDTAFKVITENSHNGCIYLLHAVSEANAAVLGDVIDNLQNEQHYNIGLLS